MKRRRPISSRQPAKCAREESSLYLALPMEMRGEVRRWLSVPERCALQRTCRACLEPADALTFPEAWLHRIALAAAAYFRDHDPPPTWILMRRRLLLTIHARGWHLRPGVVEHLRPDIVFDGTTTTPIVSIELPGVEYRKRLPGMTSKYVLVVNATARSANWGLYARVPLPMESVRGWTYLSSGSNPSDDHRIVKAAMTWLDSAAERTRAAMELYMR